MTGRLLTPRQVADALGVTPEHARRLIALRMPHYRDGRVIRVAEPDLAAYIASRTVSVTQPRPRKTA